MTEASTKRAYDPLDYETWPAEQQDFAGEVWWGIHNGDLVPLAKYLRAGHYIPPSLGVEIADAIEGKGPLYYRIKPVGIRPGEKGWADATARHERKMRIGFFVEDGLRRGGKSVSDAVILEARDKFRAKPAGNLLGKSTVYAALAYFRDFMNRTQIAPGDDLFERLRPWYSGD